MTNPIAVMDDGELRASILDEFDFEDKGRDGDTYRIMQLLKEHTERQQRELLDRLEGKIAIHWESNTVGDGLQAAIEAERKLLNDKEK